MSKLIKLVGLLVIGLAMTATSHARGAWGGKKDVDWVLQGARGSAMAVEAQVRRNVQHRMVDSGNADAISGTADEAFAGCMVGVLVAACNAYMTDNPNAIIDDLTACANGNPNAETQVNGGAMVCIAAHLTITGSEIVESGGVDMEQVQPQDEDHGRPFPKP